MKKRFSTELVYCLGLVVLALGTAFMEKADFGMSMVVAPAYLVYLKLAQIAPWFSFGMAEYCFQALLLLALCALNGKGKRMYLFSFVTAFLYGCVLDAVMLVTAFLPAGDYILRGIYFVLGMATCALGVSLMFHTYIAPEAYELFVKELSQKSGKDIHKVKTIYDCCSCLVAIVMSFLFMGFGHFEGVKLGTIVCSLVNGWLIAKCSAFLDSKFDFADSLKLRRFFE